MNLIATVEKIMMKEISEEEAKNFALTRYGELCAFIRSEAYRKLREKMYPEINKNDVEMNFKEKRLRIPKSKFLKKINKKNSSLELSHDKIS